MSVGAFIKYGAVTAKARAMYGNRLKDSDYSTLLTLKSVSDVITFLKNRPVYSSVLEKYDDKDLSREALEAALKSTVVTDFSRLSNYIRKEDGIALKLFNTQNEINFILRVFRGLKNGTAKSRNDFFGSVLNSADNSYPSEIVKLLSANTTEDFITLLNKTSYKGILDTEKINNLDYAAIENLLSARFYQKLFISLAKHCTATDLKLIRNQIGTEIDVKNLSRIIRLKKYFSVSDIKNYILPCGKRLNIGKSVQLYSSSDFFSELKKICPYYAERITENDIPNEDKILYSVNRVLLMSGQPSIAIPIAYLNLKQIEIRNLIHITESIRYGAISDKIRNRLVGIESNTEQRN